MKIYVPSLTNLSISVKTGSNLEKKITHGTTLPLSYVPFLAHYFRFLIAIIDFAPYWVKLKVKTFPGIVQKPNQTLIMENHTFTEI